MGKQQKNMAISSNQTSDELQIQEILSRLLLIQLKVTNLFFFRRENWIFITIFQRIFPQRRHDKHQTVSFLRRSLATKIYTYLFKRERNKDIRAWAKERMGRWRMSCLSLRPSFFCLCLSYLAAGFQLDSFRIINADWVCLATWPPWLQFKHFTYLIAQRVYSCQFERGCQICRVLMSPKYLV